MSRAWRVFFPVTVARPRQARMKRAEAEAAPPAPLQRPLGWRYRVPLFASHSPLEPRPLTLAKRGSARRLPTPIVEQPSPPPAAGRARSSAFRRIVCAVCAVATSRWLVETVFSRQGSASSLRCHRSREPLACGNGLFSTRQRLVATIPPPPAPDSAPAASPGSARRSGRGPSRRRRRPRRRGCGGRCRARWDGRCRGSSMCVS